MSLVLRVLFSLWLFWSSISYAQTELNNPACVFELSELSLGTPTALVSFNLPDHLKIPLIDLTRLRIKLAQGSNQAYLHHHYLNELKKLKEIFVAQGYTEEFFNDTRTFFFHELSLKNKALEQEIETKKSLTQRQKYSIHPLKGRTKQVIDVIVDKLGIPENDVTIEDLKKIKELNLIAKNITELRKGDFEGLIHLKKLYLSYNPLKTLPETVFRGLDSLKELYLHANLLTELPQNVFQELESLKWLVLYDNQLTELPQNLFQGLRKLERLDLDHNQLTGLPQTVFQGLESLEILDLSNNPITTISETVFSAPGLNQKLKLKLNHLIPLDENTRRMLRKKYGSQIKGRY